MSRFDRKNSYNDSNRQGQRGRSMVGLLLMLILMASSYGAFKMILKEHIAPQILAISDQLSSLRINTNSTQAGKGLLNQIMTGLGIDEFHKATSISVGISERQEPFYYKPQMPKEMNQQFQSYYLEARRADI